MQGEIKWQHGAPVYQRKPLLVQAFQVPAWGSKSETDIPAWLADRMNAGEVRVNHVGGLTANDLWGQRGCAPGDYILLTELDTIDFCSGADFEDLFEGVTPDV